MEDNKTKLHMMVDSIDNPKILENLVALIGEYIVYYSSNSQKSEAS